MNNNLDMSSLCKMMDNMPAGVALLAYEGERLELVHMNDRGFRVLGYIPEEGRASLGSLDAVILEEDQDRLQQATDDILRGEGTADIWVRAKTAGGGQRSLHMKGTLYEIEEGRAVILCVFMDVPDGMSAGKSVLSGWCDVEETKERIERVLAESDGSEIHAFLLVDMSSFRHISEMLGEEGGNRLLKSIADKIGKELNRSDILGRIGGDKYVIFARNVSRVYALDTIASKVARSTEVTLGSGEESFTVSGSVGMSVYPYQGSSWQELFLKAEKAVNCVQPNQSEGYHIYDLSGIYKSEMAESGKLPPEYYDEANTGIDLEDLLEQILWEKRLTLGRLRAIMKIVVRHYGFHKACLSMEDKAGRPGMELLYCNPGYERREEPGEGEDDRKWISFLRRTDLLDGFHIVHSYDDIPQELSSHMIRNQIHTMLIQPLMMMGETAGVFVMGECTGREWNLTISEQKELKRVLKLIHMYVLRYGRQQEGQKILQSLHILDDFDSYVMAVDYDNYELYFANHKLLDAMPDLQIGDSCYHAFAGRGEPCEECIMKKLSRNDPHAKCSEEQFNVPLRSWMKEHVSWLYNNEGGAGCILECMDISEYIMGGSAQEEDDFDWQRL